MPWSVHPDMPDPTARRLSPRERQVALLVAEGLKDADIAGRLGLKPGYVGVCIQRIRRRLDLGSRAEVAAWVAARRDPDELGGHLRRADPERPGPPGDESV